MDIQKTKITAYINRDLTPLEFRKIDVESYDIKDNVIYIKDKKGNKCITHMRNIVLTETTSN